jgi:aryl-alcohol dehydrogenase-like predicted oxidoreductase
MRENVGLLAYSPLAFGFLTGKYLNETPPNSRMGTFPNFTRYTNENCYKTTKEYQDLAHSFGLTLTELAIAFVHHQKFVTSTIIGATSVDQLEENINAFDVRLTDEVIEAINKIQESQPNPAP